MPLHCTHAMQEPADNASIRFFEAQFRRQLAESKFDLNPFEQRALPFLRGRVLDVGCGLGNLSLAAAAQGCSVLALDASATAIAHLQEAAHAAGLDITARQVDLRSHGVDEDFDTVVAIGLLMFFDCATALARLRSLLAHVRPGGVAVVNVLVEGTTYMDMFDPSGHCLLPAEALKAHFEGWEILAFAKEDFPAPRGLRKSFATVIARRPGVADPARGLPDQAPGRSSDA